MNSCGFFVHLIGGRISGLHPPDGLLGRRASKSCFWQVRGQDVLVNGLGGILGNGHARGGGGDSSGAARRRARPGQAHQTFADRLAARAEPAGPNLPCPPSPSTAFDAMGGVLCSWRACWHGIAARNGERR